MERDVKQEKANYSLNSTPSYMAYSSTRASMHITSIKVKITLKEHPNPDEVINCTTLKEEYNILIA